MSYKIGNYIRIRGTIKDAAGALADPTAVTLKVVMPKTGEVTAYTPTRESLGVYYSDVFAIAAGIWRYRLETSGTVVSADEGFFEVAASIAEFVTNI